MLSIRLPLLLVLYEATLGALTVAAPAGADLATRCGVKKLNATAALAKKTLSCHKKAAKQGFPVEAAV